jgi:hypothetical protein
MLLESLEFLKFEFFDTVTFYLTWPEGVLIQGTQEFVSKQRSVNPGAVTSVSKRKLKSSDDWRGLRVAFFCMAPLFACAQPFLGDLFHPLLGSHHTHRTRST